MSLWGVGARSRILPMTNFTSTRGADAVSLPSAMFRGLADDGGLFVPVALPSLDTLPPPPSPTDTGDAAAVRRIASWAAPAFLPTVAATVMHEVIEEAFHFPIPLVEVEPGRYVLELFHGPTHAFKDVGARFMAALMSRLGESGDDVRTVLVATSGDTGGAVASAFEGRAGYRVLVLFPADGISEPQRRQMTTLGRNVYAVGVSGTFDDCQRLVKAAFLDGAVGRRHRLTSANSINVARLLPQSFYYLHAAVALGAMQDRAASQAPTFVVPSGNLGNLCAGLIAQKAGMPCRGFVAATNRNRGFVDFLEGSEHRDRTAIRTTSSAMDVGAPSNLERIAWLYAGAYDELRALVKGVSVTDAEAAGALADLYERTGYVLDPHSAVAFEAATRHDAGSQGPVVVLATAHPAKFPDVVESAIGREVGVPESLKSVMDRPEESMEINPTLDALVSILDEVARG